MPVNNEKLPFLEVIKEHTAGSPMDETIKWTNLSRPEIADNLTKKGYKVSVTVVDQLLEKHHFRPRQAFKVEAGKRIFLIVTSSSTI